MTPEEAQKLIGIEGGFSVEELEEALRRRSQELESKIERAPTPGLKEKYRRNLAQVEEAWEVLSGFNDGEATPNFPSLHPTTPQRVRPPIAPGEVSQPSPDPDEILVPGKGPRGISLLITASVAAVLLLAACGYYFGVELPAQKAQLEAQAKAAAEAEHLANARGGIVIDTVPSGAAVAIPGSDPEKTPTTISGLKLGPHPVHITLDGYDTLDLTVEVTENQFKDLGKIPLKRSLGDLSLTTDPPGAQFILDGPDAVEKSGTTPATLEGMPTGGYKVSFTLDGCSFHGTTQVSAKQTTSYQQQLPIGTMDVESTPSGAEIFLGSQSLGTTPLNVKMAAGPVTLTAKYPNLADVSQAITVVTDTTTTSTFTFDDGTLKVSSSVPDTEVWHDDTLLGTTPLSIGPIPSGPYSVVLKHRGYNDSPQSANIEKGQEATINASLSVSDSISLEIQKREQMKKDIDSLTTSVAKLNRESQAAQSSQVPTIPSTIALDPAGMAAQVAQGQQALAEDRRLVALAQKLDAKAQSEAAEIEDDKKQIESLDSDIRQSGYVEPEGNLQR